jgi:hypothetical protein
MQHKLTAADGPSTQKNKYDKRNETVNQTPGRHAAPVQLMQL